MSERGSASIEFALVLPLVLVVLLGIVEVLVVARTQLEVGQAAREGARQAATTPDVSSAVAAARRALPDGIADTARVAVHREQHVGGAARVTVSVDHRVAIPLLGGFGVTLRSVAVMWVER